MCGQHVYDLHQRLKADHPVFFYFFTNRRCQETRRLVQGPGRRGRKEWHNHAPGGQRSHPQHILQGPHRRRHTHQEACAGQEACSHRRPGRQGGSRGTEEGPRGTGEGPRCTGEGCSSSSSCCRGFAQEICSSAQGTQQRQGLGRHTGCHQTTATGHCAECHAKHVCQCETCSPCCCCTGRRRWWRGEEEEKEEEKTGACVRYGGHPGPRRRDSRFDRPQAHPACAEGRQGSSATGAKGQGRHAQARGDRGVLPASVYAAGHGQAGRRCWWWRWRQEGEDLPPGRKEVDQGDSCGASHRRGASQPREAPGAAQEEPGPVRGPILWWPAAGPAGPAAEWRSWRPSWRTTGRRQQPRPRRARHRWPDWRRLACCWQGCLWRYQGLGQHLGQHDPRPWRHDWCSGELTKAPLPS
ncbi:hypothetical protein BD289DRAFT_18502 [Coniella lustricola]|uniref:Uncharacterized protein n=1 Tax=Coniella lustricola TaxID=2025994 RepID=A0A2T3AJK0_9PEZI|nr:hypothetical protein BD289DRAFT_18502 [Coniella lustricola]